MKSYKNNSKFYLSIVILILFILNLALIFSIWYPRLKGPGRKNLGISEHDREMVQRYMERQLNLSPEQSANMAKLRDAHFIKADSLTEEINQIRKEIMDELFNNSPDKDKVQKLVEALGTKQVELERLNFSHFQDLLSLCKPDQKEKFKTLLSDLLERMRPPKPRQPLDNRQPPWEAGPGRDQGPSPGHEPPPPMPGGPGFGPMDPIRHLTEKLQLSEEQQKQVKSIMESFRPHPGEGKDSWKERDQKIMDILTPEQKAIFEKMKKERPPERR